MSSGDVQTAVDELALELGQSVLIEDVDQFPIWWSTVGPVDPVREKTILYRQVNAETANVVERFDLIHAQQPIAIPAIPELQMWARWVMPIRRHQQVLGFLWVLDPGLQITNAQLELIIECASEAALEMAAQARNEENKPVRRAQLLQRLMYRFDREAFNELCKLEKLPAESLVQVCLPAKAGGWALGSDMSAHIVGVREITATSGPAIPLSDLHISVARAQKTNRAILAGAVLSEPSYSNLGSWHLVVANSAEIEPKDIHPGIEYLLQDPKDEMLETVRTILRHAGDMAAAASELFIHRSTLYYRLDRIMETTGIDLKEETQRVELLFALRLADYQAVTRD